MVSESKQRTQKVIEYQEAGSVLRATENARRTTVFFCGVMLPGFLGYIFSRAVPVDVCAYLSIVSSIVSLVSFRLCMKYTKDIKLTSKKLLALQDAIGGSVYSGSTLTGLSERNFYILIYALVGVVLVVTSVIFIRDASARNQLIFQSCGPCAKIAPSDVKVACPCGKYPFLNEKQGACRIRSSFDEKGL